MSMAMNTWLFTAKWNTLVSWDNTQTRAVAMNTICNVSCHACCILEDNKLL